jgi:hypothetical protein
MTEPAEVIIWHHGATRPMVGGAMTELAEVIIWHHDATGRRTVAS